MVSLYAPSGRSMPQHDELKLVFSELIRIHSISGTGKPKTVHDNSIESLNLVSRDDGSFENDGENNILTGGDSPISTKAELM